MQQPTRAATTENHIGTSRLKQREQLHLDAEAERHGGVTARKVHPLIYHDSAFVT